MKIRRYEKTVFLYGWIIIIILLEIVGFYELSKVKVIKFHTISAIVTNDKNIVIIAKPEVRKNIYKNVYLYYKDKKYKYYIEKDEKCKDDKELYYTLTLKTKFPKKENDIITIEIEKEKINMIEVIKSAWDGDEHS